MKKKHFISSKDKRDWTEFVSQIGDLSPKEEDFNQKNKIIDKIPKLDLHGFSLIESNKLVKQFIAESYDSGYKKLLIVTGKGLRSKSSNNPTSSACT